MKADKKLNDNLIRLNKFIAEAGVCSRRQADLLITNGRVLLNGKKIFELGIKINPTIDAIEINGKRLITENQHLVYIILNKPRGVLTTVRDPFNRPTVMNLVNIPARVYPVGRLDQDSEGLLLFTNDGELANRLIHPRHNIKKLYHVRVNGHPSESAIARLTAGIDIDGRMTLPCSVHRLSQNTHSTQFEVEIREGRKRQIRRMFQAIGHEVIMLKRIKIGPIELKKLPVGTWRYLTDSEIKCLKKEVGIEIDAHSITQCRKDIEN